MKKQDYGIRGHSSMISANFVTFSTLLPLSANVSKKITPPTPSVTTALNDPYKKLLLLRIPPH